MLVTKVLLIRYRRSIATLLAGPFLFQSSPKEAAPKVVGHLPRSIPDSHSRARHADEEMLRGCREGCSFTARSLLHRPALRECHLGWDRRAYTRHISARCRRVSAQLLPCTQDRRVFPKAPD